MRIILALLLSGHCFAATFEEAADEIVRAGRFIDGMHLCPATSGNFSMRLEKDLMAITASGKHKGQLTQEDVLLANLEGKVQTPGKKPSAETLLHGMLYSLFDDVGAVLHTHNLSATVLTRQVSENVLITKGYEMHKAFGIPTHESEMVFPIFENSQDMAALSKEVASYMKEHPKIYAFLLRGHGAYTWGKNMSEAKIRVEALDHLLECEILERSLKQ